MLFKGKNLNEKIIFANCSIRDIKWKELAQKLEKENGKLSPHIYPQFLWDEEISPNKG